MRGFDAALLRRVVCRQGAQIRDLGIDARQVRAEGRDQRLLAGRHIAALGRLGIGEDVLGDVQRVDHLVAVRHPAGAVDELHDAAEQHRGDAGENDARQPKPHEDPLAEFGARTQVRRRVLGHVHPLNLPR
ncbi:MAG: hypothetical protein WDN03_03800 [Rhizomicrobium sp.]